MPTYETSTGYAIGWRPLPPGTPAQVEAAVRREWVDRAPVAPVATVETGPGTEEQIVNATAPDHLRALAAFDREVAAEVTRRLTAFISAYCLTPRPEDVARAVAEYRAALGAVGATLPDDEAERDTFLWRIALPNVDEQSRLTLLVYGALESEVDALLRSFRRPVAGAADRVPDDAERRLELQPGAPVS